MTTTVHSLEQHTAHTIDRLGLLRRSSPVLVALSGGADSVALLSILCRLGYDCIAAHCNYHLRGEESNRDMRHAESIAARLGVNIYVRDFDVAQRIRTTGESVEMACRELRYQWFDDLLDRDCSQAIAVAHHREDNAETFLINLLRTTGIAGLTGMDYRRGTVVRPLLDVSRADIEQYLDDTGLGYVTDSTNALNDYRRNKLRNIIIPTLEQHFPGATYAILTTMGHLRDARILYDDAVQAARTAIGATDRRIDLTALTKRYTGHRPAILLYEMLKPYGFNPTHTSDILVAASANRTGRHFTSPTHRAELDRGILSIAPIDGHCDNAPDTHSVNLRHDILSPLHIQVSTHDITQFKPERDPNIAYIDIEALEDQPRFEIRHPRRGDRFKPYGMTGEKLVSDLLKDAKLSAADKRNVWLLTRNDRILWVIGLRASRLFAITPQTRRYLKLTLARHTTKK